MVSTPSPQPRAGARFFRAGRGLLCLAVLAGVAPATPVVAAPPGAAAPGSSRFYCCADANGKHVCGDILPAVCYGRAYRELGADGRTLREIEAPLTAEQRAQRAAEEEQRKIEEVRLKEQQRKDQALMDTYVSVEDIENLRRRALGEVNRQIGNAENRIVEIRGSRKKFEDEAEFYTKKPMPAEVRKGLSDTEFEIKAQESIIEAKKKEIALIQAKYDQDRKRFLDLQQRGKRQR